MAAVTDEILASTADGGIVTLRLNRPDSRNAMSSSLVTAMIDRLEACARDAACRAVIVAGEGRGFCAGSDLSGLAAMDAAARSAFEADSGLLARRITSMPVPVIAAVHGFAIGGGLTLAASCDIVLSDPRAKWSLPEVHIGLFPAWGLWAVEDRAGRIAARRLSWGIDTIDGREAHRIGLVDDLADAPLERAMAIAGRLAALPDRPMRQVKEYFSHRDGMERDDRLANMLFMEASEGAAAKASFARFA